MSTVPLPSFPLVSCLLVRWTIQSSCIAGNCNGVVPTWLYTQELLAKWSNQPSERLIFRYCMLLTSRSSPLTSNGIPVLPTGMKDYVRERETFIECNCGILYPAADHEPLSCRMVVSKATSEVIAFCNKRPSICGMICKFFIQRRQIIFVEVDSMQ
ncbi:hypothetical protein BDZ97DRAFT_74911 [Flammula alnicola]|nr:hypothetical protein BDZ97DRAFT_74911 [Flammula alnicola]